MILYPSYGWVFHQQQPAGQRIGMNGRFSSLMARAAILVQQGERQAALVNLDEAVAVARAEFSEHDKRLAQALEMRCNVYRALDRRIDAERDMSEAVMIRLKHVRRKCAGLSQAHKYQEAEHLYREALDTCHRFFGPRHRETATCLDNLASNLRLQSRFEEAVIHATEALDIRQEILGVDHAHTAASLCNLGFLYRILGRYEEAVTHILKSLVIRERRLGPAHPLVAENHDRLASTYRDLSRFDEAEDHCKRALKIRTEALGADHPLTAASKNQLALIRERRSDGATALGGDGVAVSKPSVPTPIVTPAAKQREEGHVVGYAILAALILGGGASAALAWYLPYFGAAAGIVVVAFTAVSFLFSLPFEAVVLRGVGWLRRLMVKPDLPDRDVIVLGRPMGEVEIGPASRSKVLTADNVNQLPNRAVLDLYWVVELTLAAAEALAARNCRLQLNAVRALPSKLARALKTHRGSLHLNTVAELTTAAAAHIARHNGPMLQLNGLRTLTCDVAEHLAHHRGELHLDGLHAVDHEAAEWLVKHGGRLTLLGLRVVSRQTVRLLRTNSFIVLPDELGDGI